MQTSLPISVAVLLAACGVAATSSNDMADAQARGGKQKQRPSIGFENFEQGGMAGCFDPKLSGYARQAAERAGGRPCGDAPAASPAGADSWIGEYEGPFDGATGHVSIARAGSGLTVEVSMFSDHGCGGSASGRGAVQGNRLTLTMPPQESGQCRIVMTRQGSGFAVQEDSCTYYHGRSCEFTGSVTRQGQRAPVRTATSSPRPASWIVGAWVARGDSCASHAPLVFNADGVYRGSGVEGRWSLSGNTLGLRFREADLVDGPFGPERRYSGRLVRIGPDEMTFGGDRLKRCPPNGGAEPWYPNERFTR